jgi:hypothetical protein
MCENMFCVEECVSISSWFCLEFNVYVNYKYNLKVNLKEVDCEMGGEWNWFRIMFTCGH